MRFFIAKLYRTYIGRLYLIMANVLTSFLIPDYLLDELKVVAEKNCLSVSAQLRTLIVNYLKEQKESQSN